MESSLTASTQIQPRPPGHDQPAIVDYFPAGQPTRNFVRNCGHRFQIHYTQAGKPCVVSLPPPEPGQEPEAYFTSVSATLLDYSLSSIPAIHRRLSHTDSSFSGNILRQVVARPRRTVGLFNAPFSNVHTPPDYLEILRELLPQYQDLYPDSPIVLRGLIRGQLGHTFPELKKLGFDLIPYRKIYLFDGRTTSKLRKQTKIDLRLLEKNRERISFPSYPLADEDYKRIAHLHRELYVSKYSCLNADYSGAAIRYLHEQGWLKLILYRDPDGSILGMGGYTSDGRMLNSSLLGYVLERNQIKPSIYGLLYSAMTDLALKEGIVDNLGAGSTKYKILRGGVLDLEFMAIHAPLQVRLRFAGRFLGTLGKAVFSRS